MVTLAQTNRVNPETLSLRLELEWCPVEDIVLVCERGQQWVGDSRLEVSALFSHREMLKVGLSSLEMAANDASRVFGTEGNTDEYSLFNDDAQ